MASLQKMAAVAPFCTSVANGNDTTVHVDGPSTPRNEALTRSLPADHKDFYFYSYLSCPGKDLD